MIDLFLQRFPIVGNPRDGVRSKDTEMLNANGRMNDVQLAKVVKVLRVKRDQCVFSGSKQAASS